MHKNSNHNLKSTSPVRLSASRLSTGIISLSIMALLSTPVFAQGQKKPDKDKTVGLEEIIVTARRVAENLQSTPVTVTAFTRKGLQMRGITDTAEVAAFTPNTTFDTTSTFSGASSTFQGFIRGIGQSDFAINTDPGVGVYIDGVYIARTVGSIFKLYDVAQIEVLKGPQGTLFGRNTIGGALNIRTIRPTDTFYFKSSVAYGRFNYVGIDGLANIPIAKNLYSTIAFSTRREDGYQKRIIFDGPGAKNVIPLDRRNVANTNGLAGGGLNNQSIRGKILWEASDNFETTLSADYSNIKDAAPPGTLIAMGSTLQGGKGFDTNKLVPGTLLTLYNGCLVLSKIPAAAGFPAPVCNLLPNGTTNANADGNPNNNLPTYGSQFLTHNIDQTYATGANFSNINSWGISSISTYQFSENHQFKSITAYRKLDANFGRDIDGSPLTMDQTSFVIEEHQFSQEIQLNGNFFKDRLDYTVGSFYFSEKAKQYDKVPIGGGLLNIAGSNSQDTRSYALFGEVNYEIIPKVKIVFGARYSNERKRLYLDQQNTSNFFGIVFANPATGLIPVDAAGNTPFPRTNPDGTPNIHFLGPKDRQVANFSNVSIRAGLNWQINDNVYSYFTFSQGFKSGGFTTRLTAPFNPKFDFSVLGVPPAGILKTITFQPETANNYEVGIKADLLDNRLRANFAAFWNNYKGIQIVVQRGITPANENAGDARLRGMELELEAYPTDKLSLVAAFGYIDAEYTYVDPAAAPIVKGSRLQNTPKWTAAVAANYIQPVLKGKGNLTLNVNWSWKSKIYNDAENTPELVQGSVGLLGASLKYAPTDGNWALSLIGRNITNSRFIGSGFNSGGLSFVEATYNRPAEWRLKLDVNF